MRRLDLLTFVRRVSAVTLSPNACRMSQVAERVYFKVPFDEKDDAKALGARFDGDQRLWYAPDDYIREALAARWQTVSAAAGGGFPAPQQWQNQYQSQQPQYQNGDERILYEVPFDDNQDVKAAGARFDGQARKWCGVLCLCRRPATTP